MTHSWQTGTAASGGEDIYYEVIGDASGPAIMLTHGAGGCHAIWYQQVPVFADAGYRVVTWDCRGFGNSSFRSGMHGCDAAVADMTAVLDAAGLERAHLVGQSMGGWWVTAFALAQPSRTATLTLSNTVGGLWTNEITQHFATWARGAALDEGQTIGSHNALAPGFGDRDPARAFLYQQINTFHTPPMADIGKALMGSHVKHADLDATGVPVQLITSSEDALFPAPLVIDSMKRLRDPRIVEIDGAGHSAYFEKPDEYNDAVLSHIRTAHHPSP
jgi:pimeloyl-ACP methyl ester carboxylesterase